MIPIYTTYVDKTQKLIYYAHMSGMESRERHPKEIKRKIAPREIEGLQRQLTEKTHDGSTEYGTAPRLAVTAVFGGEQNRDILFTTRPEDSGKKQIDVAFIVEFPRISLGELLRRYHSEEVSPPFLIVAVVGGKGISVDTLKYAEERALAHNTAEMVTFLQKGGKKEELTATAFAPTDAELQELLQKKN